MTKEAFEALKSEFADQCCMIGLDNGRALFIGYGMYQVKNLVTDRIEYVWDKDNLSTDPKTKTPIQELIDENPTAPISLNDISTVTKGGEDFLEVHYYHKKSQGNTEYELVSFIPLDQIQSFVVCPTKDKDGKRILPDRHSLN